MRIRSRIPFPPRLSKLLVDLTQLKKRHDAEAANRRVARRIDSLEWQLLRWPLPQCLLRELLNPSCSPRTRARCGPHKTFKCLRCFGSFAFPPFSHARFFFLSHSPQTHFFSHFAPSRLIAYNFSPGVDPIFTSRARAKRLFIYNREFFRNFLIDQRQGANLAKCLHHL